MARRRWIQLGLFALVLAVVLAGVRRLAFMAVERNGLIAAPNVPETPQTFGARPTSSSRS
jgi:hypothetical protein